MSAQAGGRRDNALLTLARIPVVRRLWAAITFSSFGDWLGLLANTALAQQLTNHQSSVTQGVAISGVLLVKLSPDLLFGPIAAALADKLDRRKLVIVGDLTAGILYASIAIGYNLVWLYVAQFVIEAVGLFTQPAKQVIQTTIVPKRLLATANQISLFSVYGTVPIAAGVFALLSTANRLVSGRGTVDVAIVIALLLDTVSFVVSSATVYLSRHLIPVAPGERERGKSIVTLLREGVGFVRGQSVIRALYVGIVGAFAGGGLVVGVAQLWTRTLHAGAAGYSVLFGTVFTGLALGMLLGPRVLPTYTRSRVFALAIASAGVALVVMSLLSDLTLAVLFAALVGLFSGMAWIIGYTLIGLEVEDRMRGRVFAFVMSSVRLTLLLSIAVGPVIAGALGDHTLRIGHRAEIDFSGPGLTLLIGGVLALLVGGYALRRATPSATRLRDLVRRRIVRSGAGAIVEHSGMLVTVDGADPVLTARCTGAVAADLRARGLVVLVTGEPAGGSVGVGVRSLLGPAGSGAPGVEPETAALLSAAERAEHVATVVRPALERGETVVCDRFVLTSMALYGGGRGADVERIRLADQWATAGIRPDLTVVVAGPAPALDGGGVVDAAGIEAVLHEAVDADRDRHVLVEPADLADGLDGAGGAEVRRRLDRLVRTRRDRLARGVPGPAVGGDGTTDGPTDGPADGPAEVHDVDGPAVPVQDADPSGAAR